MEPIYATLKAGLAIAPLLRTSVPEYLSIVGAEAELPPLPDFMVNLYLSNGASEITEELARHIRQAFEQRFGVNRPPVQLRRSDRESPAELKPRAVPFPTRRAG